MSLPYSVPVAVKTKKRCQFSMPGRHYNCRAMGKYVMCGKGYCAPHYDATWKLANPIIGQQHDWHFRVDMVTGKQYEILTCRMCGAVKVHDGLPQLPCRGKLSRIVLR